MSPGPDGADAGDLAAAEPAAAEPAAADPAAADPAAADLAPRPGRAARRRARRRPAPLPQRAGLDAVRWQVPHGPASGRSGSSVRSEQAGQEALPALSARFPALTDPAATPLADRFARGEIVDADGRALRADTLIGPGDELWFHRELRPELVPAVELEILHHDEHLLVLDKPHDMATMPRGAHVLSSALVRLRRATGIETLVPLHRLDRRTAGVLAFGVRPEERAAYQQLFARGEIAKEYEARVRPRPDSSLPTMPGERCVMMDHLVKHRGELTTQVMPGTPNAETVLEVAYMETGGILALRLHPRTGRTHQLRAQLASRGAPILGEDLYGEELSAEQPLQLLARSLRFTDPFTGRERAFRSGQHLAPGAPLIPER